MISNSLPFCFNRVSSFQFCFSFAQIKSICLHLDAIFCQQFSVCIFQYFSCIKNSEDTMICILQVYSVYKISIHLCLKTVRHGYRTQVNLQNQDQKTTKTADKNIKKYKKKQNKEHLFIPSCDF